MSHATFYRRSREGYRTNVKKIVQAITNAFDNRQTIAPDLDQLKIFQNNLQRFDYKLEELNTKISSELSDDEVADETDSCLQIQEAIWTTMSNIEILLQGNDCSVNCVSAAASISAPQVKLPKLDLPKFSGDPLTWQSFWDSYDSTIYRSDMSTIDKFKYLKGLLKGDAANLIDGFRLIEANYETVVDTLKERYGNPEVSIFAHFDHLLSLPSTTREFNNLQQTYDECEKHIRSLVALGLEEATFGKVFIPIILSKLPRNTRVELHRLNGSQSWTLANLRELFKKELVAQQMGEWTLNDKDHKSNSSSTAKQQHHSSHSSGKQNYRKTFPPTSTFVQNGKPKSRVTCIFCRESHYSDQCRKINDSQARRNMAKQNRHCFKCLSVLHQAAKCPKNSRCFHCSDSGHHSALCNRKNDANRETTMCASNEPINEQLDSNDQSTATSRTKSAATFSAVANGTVYMQMAQVSIPNSTGNLIPTRVYLDPGSSCSYVTEAIAKRLCLKPFGSATVANARFEDSKRSVKSYKCVKLQLPTKEGIDAEVEAFVTSFISVPIEKLPLDTIKHPILQKVQLADTIASQPETVNIDILIGGDFYYNLVDGENIRLADGLVLLGSKLGYITAGMVIDASKETAPRMSSSMLIFSGHECKLRNVDVEQFWSLEDIGIKDDPYQLDNDSAVKQFNSTIRRCPDNRYEVGWPWKDLKPELPTNEHIAMSRLRSLVRRLQTQPELFQKYHATILDKLNADTIEQVPKSLKYDNALVHYIPHHCVVKDDKTTTKLRIVYDASCKANTKELSLNECLLRGPVYLNDLCGLLLRFRSHSIAVVSDIEKAFLQVGLRSQDRDVTRFFWLRDITKPLTIENIIVYRFKKVPFGVKSSPFLLEGTVRHHLRNKVTPFAEMIASNTYVDNEICGVDSAQEALELYATAKSLFSEISMNLREWFTNCEQLKLSFKTNDRGSEESTTVLGTTWNTITDNISIQIQNITNFAGASTKRQILQATSSMFDPCGLLSPITFRGKILLQGLWKSGLKWDNEVGNDTKLQWNTIADDYKCCTTKQIPRNVIKTTKTNQIHCFCDASGKAYGAAVYIRPLVGEPYLIFAKARVAPTKSVTLPRLELMAVVVGVRLVNFVKKQLHGFQFDNSFIWTDSKCVLYWIGSNKLKSTFVSNRVREIKASQSIFRYVPTDHNSADLLSRGISFIDLNESDLWWNGPKYLAMPECEWPTTILLNETEKATPFEETSFVAPANKLENANEGPFTMQAKRYSSLQRLLIVTAYVNRFIQKCFRKGLSEKAAIIQSYNAATDVAINAAEIHKAKLHWIFVLQRSINITERGYARRYNPVKDNVGLWRCSGRLINAEIPTTAISSVLLPRDHAFTELLVRNYHVQAYHSGVNSTVASVRSEYWIPKLRPLVKKVIRECVVCRIWTGGPYQSPPQAQLPKFRVTQAAPFASTGIDYMGPLLVRDTTDVHKVWICLFTCAVTRALHLEVINDMTTEQFLLALRRFIASRGKPNMIVSDNAKGFKLANKVLHRLWLATIKGSATNSFIAENQIEWKFIPEHSPWMGGFYERLVGSVKQCMKKALGRQSLNLTQLQTIVREVSAILNDRPLLTSNEICDTVLTPAMLLGKQQKTSYCSFSTYDSTSLTVSSQLKNDLVARWRYQNEILNQFWNIWRTQYLTSLREFQKLRFKHHGVSNTIPRCGTVVLVKERTPRSQWKLARIVKLRTSEDGLVRSAVVQLSNKSEIIRPIRLLCPLEYDPIPPDDTMPLVEVSGYAEKINGNISRLIKQTHSITNGADGNMTQTADSMANGNLSHMTKEGDITVCEPTDRRTQTTQLSGIESNNLRIQSNVHDSVCRRTSDKLQGENSQHNTVISGLVKDECKNASDSAKNQDSAHKRPIRKAAQQARAQVSEWVKTSKTRFNEN